MLKFISFGSGSSGNCYFLYTETDGLMIDVGVGFRFLKKRFHEYGLSLSRINNILVTHDHADHIKSVGSLSHEIEKPVYTTHKVHVGIGKNYSVKNKIEPAMASMLAEDVPLQIGEFMVTPFHVPHDSTDNVGYKIVCEAVTFVLITDAGHITDHMKEIIGEADYLVIEANHDEEMLMKGSYPQHLKTRIMGPNGHLCNKACAVAIAENANPQLRCVWLCHLSEENNHPELARKTVEQGLRSYGLITGKDFELEVLKRKHPSGPYELIK